MNYCVFRRFTSFSFRLSLLLYWLACSTATAAVFSAVNQSRPINGDIRKFFHLVVMVVCVSGLLADPVYTYVASVMIVGCMVLAEVGSSIVISAVALRL